MRYHDYPKQLEEHYIARMRETYARRAVAPRGDPLARVPVIYAGGPRAQGLPAFGPLPPRTPLNERVWRVSDHGSSGSSTSPSRAPARLAGSTEPHPPSAAADTRAPEWLLRVGIATTARRTERYAGACVRLARERYAALIYDPVNQGEREVSSLARCGRAAIAQQQL